MASLSYIASASVERETASVSEVALNKVAVLAYTTAFAERYRVYTTLDAVAADFATTTPVYLAASAFFAISPRPSTFTVLRAALPSTKVVTITPTAANSKAYKMKVNGTEYSYTSDASGTAQEIVEGLKALIDAGAVSGLTVTEDNTVMTLTWTSGTYGYVEVTSTADDGQLAILETTADPGMSTDLTACQAAYKDWYAFGVLDNSEAVNLAASSWAESNGKFFVALTNDTVVLNNTASNQAADLVAGTRERTLCFYHQAPAEFAQFRLLAKVLSTTPGKRAFHHKALTGLTVSSLTDTQINNLITNNVNYFVEYGSLNRTEGGKVSSGEWADIIIGGDYYDKRLEADLVSMFLREPDKIDFDNGGIGKIQSVMMALVEEMVRGKFVRLDFDTYPELGYGLTVPDEDDVSDADFAARTFTGMSAEVQLRGAIKKVTTTLRLVA